MKYYTVAEIDVIDSAWVADYVAKVTRLVEQHGGVYLARTPKVETLEGEPSKRGIVLVIEWPSREAAKSFYESPGYRPYREARIAGARNQVLLVAGEDVTGAATIRT